MSALQCELAALPPALGWYLPDQPGAGGYRGLSPKTRLGPGSAVATSNRLSQRKPAAALA